MSTTELQPTSKNLSVFFADVLRRIWESDDSRPWDKPYSKTDRFRYSWDFREVEHRK